MPRRAAAILGLGLAALVAVACREEAPADPRPLVVVSVLPQQYVVDRVAGDLVRVAVLIPPGANPTTHEPTVAERRALEEADLYVKVGHPHFAFERAWLDRLLADRPSLRVVAGWPDSGDDSPDPHAWLAPARMRELTERVGSELAALLPAHREQIAAQAASLQGEIDAVDREVREILATALTRRFYVVHPAWGHFAAAYGLEQVSLEQGHKEPGLRQLRDLLQDAARDAVRVVFVQPQFDASVARAFAEEVGARVETLDPLAYDWPSNLRTAAKAIAAQ